MNRNDLVRIALAADRVILQSRMSDLMLIAEADRSERVGAIAGVLSKLQTGAYLVGCGPYCCGLIPLSVDEVVLGRPPSPLESLPDTVADYALNDAVWLIPREASRIHATVIRRTNDGVASYFIRDEQSRAGTFVNRQRIASGGAVDAGHDLLQLSTGDVISLGPSGINAFVFIDVDAVVS